MFKRGAAKQTGVSSAVIASTVSQELFSEITNRKVRCLCSVGTILNIFSYLPKAIGLLVVS